MGNKAGVAVVAVVFVSLLATLGAAPAFAQATRFGPTFTAISSTESLTTGVAYDPVHHMYLVIGGRGYGKMYGSFIREDGTQLGAFPLADPGAYWEAGNVAYSPDLGAFLAVWTNGWRQEGDIAAVWGRLVAANADGSPNYLSDVFRITVAPNPDGTGGEPVKLQQPAVAYSTNSSTGTKEFMVGYVRESGYVVRCRYITFSGTAPNMAATVSGTMSFPSPGEYPSIAFNPTLNEFMVTYRYEAEPGGVLAADIYGFRVNAVTGDLASGIISINGTTTGNLSAPTIAFDAGRQLYFVVWWTDRGWTFGRFLGADGATEGPAPIGRYSLVQGFGSYDQVSMGRSPFDGSFFIVGCYGNYEDAYGFRLSADGTVQEPVIQVTDTPIDPNSGQKMAAFSAHAAGHASQLDWLVTAAPAQMYVAAQIVRAAPPVMSISSIVPSDGPTGDLPTPQVVTINGSMFQPGAVVTFNGIAAASTVDSSSVIHATVPVSYVPGTVAVTVRNPDNQEATRANGYTYWTAITISISVTGNGTVTAPGINCSAGTCSYAMRTGSPITLTSTPAPGNMFAGWGGSASADCLDGVLNMDANATCAARFIADRSIDFNADGRADLVWRNRTTGQIIVWNMAGSAYLAYSTIATPRGSQVDTNWTIGAIADFNLDERPDLVWQNRITGATEMWLNNGNGTVTPYALLPAPDINWRIGGAGDFNGDGFPDILWRDNATGRNLVWYMNGSTVISVADISAVANPNWRIAAVADFNSDRKPDVLWRNVATGEVQIWIMDRLAYVRSIILPVAAPDWNIAGAWDFGTDGKPDIVWRNGTTGQNCVWYLADGVYAGTDWLPSVPDQAWDIVRPPESRGAGSADMNSDGSADIVWRDTTTGENRVWYLNGTSLVSSTALPPVSDVSWKIAGIADFNGDGRSDLLWHNGATGQTLLWYMGGHTYIGFATVNDANPAYDGWQIAAVADFNGDGKPDLVWHHATSGLSVIWFMDGARYVGFAQLMSAPPTWTITGAGDFNGDGKPDLVWRNQVTGENAVWIMDGANYVGFTPLPTIADTNWQMANVADYNGNGKPDIVWHNRATGAVIIWYMNGGAYAGFATLPTEGNTAWVVAPGLQ